MGVGLVLYGIVSDRSTQNCLTLLNRSKPICASREGIFYMTCQAHRVVGAVIGGFADARLIPV